MPQLPPVAVLFVALAVLFLTAAVRDYLRSEGKMTPARRAYLGMATVFAAVGIGLCAVQVLF